MSNDNIYEDRYCLYADIIGFTNMIKSSNDPVYNPKKIKEVLENIIYFKNILNEKNIKKGNVIAATYFSDSIVISYPSIYEQNLTLLLIDASIIVKMMSKMGLAIRGGISKGLMYHKDELCFGPAFISAYTLESHIAFYPRIIIDKTINIQTDCILKTEIGKDDCIYINKKLVKKDFDGIYCMDLYEVLNDDFDLIKKYRNIILEHIKNESELHNIQKWTYLFNQLNIEM